MVKLFTRLLAVLVLGSYVVIIFASSGTAKSGALVLAIVVVVGALEFLTAKQRDRLTRWSGKALFEEAPPEPFDADAAFERAMRKGALAEQSQDELSAGISDRSPSL